MKISCDVIRDLLPLYVEDMVSEDSRELIERHIAGCPKCTVTLETLREPVQIPPEPDPEHIKNLGKRMLQRTILLVMAMVFFVTTVVTWTFAVLAISSVPVSLEDSVLGVIEEDGKVFVELRVTGNLSWWHERDYETPSWWNVQNPEIGSEIACLSVNRRLWDVLFGGETSVHTYQVPVRDSASVWFFSGNDAQCIFGDERLTPKHNVDPVLWTALVAAVMFLICFWLTKWKWLGTGALFAGNLLLADFVITLGVWQYDWYRTLGVFWVIFLFMALLLTCCEVFAYHLWKERDQI